MPQYLKTEPGRERTRKRVWACKPGSGSLGTKKKTEPGRESTRKRVWACKPGSGSLGTKKRTTQHSKGLQNEAEAECPLESPSQDPRGEAAGSHAPPPGYRTRRVRIFTHPPRKAHQAQEDTCPSGRFLGLLDLFCWESQGWYKWAREAGSY